MLADDLVDLALMTKGLRTAEEVRTRWPYVLSRLKAAAASVRRLKPHLRRQPDADHSLDWLFRSIVDAPVGEDRRAEALDLVAAIKVLIGAPAAEWKSSPPRRRRVTPA